MPVGTPTPYPPPFPDDNLSAVRFFRQNWYPDWEFAATEDLRSSLVGTAEWNTNNPRLPVPADASNNPSIPTSRISSPQIRPYYYDPDCPPIGTSGVEDGSPYTGRGAWLSFDTLNLDYIVNSGELIYCAGSQKPYHFAPSAGFIVGATYLWWPNDDGLRGIPQRIGVSIQIQEDPARKIVLPCNNIPIAGEGESYYVQRKRFSFYLWTNPYDVIEIFQDSWSLTAPGPSVFGNGYHVTLFWKETPHANPGDVPLDPIDPGE